MMADARAGGENGDPGEGDGHASGFDEGEPLEAEAYGERERVDGRETNDDGGVRDVGVAKTEGETELVDGEEAEVSEGRKVEWRV